MLSRSHLGVVGVGVLLLRLKTKATGKITWCSKDLPRSIWVDSTKGMVRSRFAV